MKALPQVHGDRAPEQGGEHLLPGESVGASFKGPFDGEAGTVWDSHQGRELVA